MFALHSSSRRAFVVVAALAGSGLGSVVYGQADATTAWVQGSGTVISERMPEVLRVQVQLSGRGKSLTEALAALRDRREAAKAVLPTLGATVESIKFDDPQLTRGDEQQKMNQMIMDRMGRTKRGTKSETALPTTATVNLTAEWPLAATDVEQLLATAHELQEKIKAADLGGTKEAVKLTPEEEELQAEMAQMMSQGSQGPPPGEPQFTYIAKVAAEDRAKLTAEAFQKAKADAERLATAADAKLGKLISLQSNAQSAAMDESYSDYGGNAYYYELQRRQMLMLRGATGDDAGAEASTEAVGLRPAKVKYAVQVSASFGLQ